MSNKYYKFSRLYDHRLSEQSDSLCQQLHLFSYFDTISKNILHNIKETDVINSTFTHDHSVNDRRRHKTVYNISIDNNIICSSYIKFDVSCPFDLLTVKTKYNNSLRTFVHYILNISKR